MILVDRISDSFFIFYRLFNKLTGLSKKLYYHSKYGALKKQFNYIGKNVIFDYNIWFNGAHNISIGSGTFIGKDTILNAYTKITIGNNCSIAAGCRIITGNHGYERLDIPYNKQDFHLKPVVLEDYIWLGYNVIILPGVKLGKGCVVAAGSVVTKSFDENLIIGGMPARILGKRNTESSDI